jgi:regulator of sirC expression with transglutaminase-like and TPR domain
MGDSQGALDDYNQAIRLNPQDVRAHHNRGRIRANLGDREGALEDLRRAADLYRQTGDATGYRTVITEMQAL